MREKPKEMSIAEYNQLLLDDALKALIEARGHIAVAKCELDEAMNETYKAVENITVAYTQMRLDV